MSEDMGDEPASRRKPHVRALPKAAALIALGSVMSLVMCQSSLVCPPGESIGCVGPQACQGYQVCTSSGTGFDPCVCGNPDAGSLTDGGADAISPDDAISPADAQQDAVSTADSSVSDAVADTEYERCEHPRRCIDGCEHE